MTKSLFTATKYAQFAKALCMSSPQLVAVKNKSNRLSKTTTIIVGDFDTFIDNFTRQKLVKKRPKIDG